MQRSQRRLDKKRARAWDVGVGGFKANWPAGPARRLLQPCRGLHDLPNACQGVGRSIPQLTSHMVVCVEHITNPEPEAVEPEA